MESAYLIWLLVIPLIASLVAFLGEPDRSQCTAGAGDHPHAERGCGAGPGSDRGGSGPGIRRGIGSQSLAAGGCAGSHLRRDRRVGGFPGRAVFHRLYAARSGNRRIGCAAADDLLRSLSLLLFHHAVGGDLQQHHHHVGGHRSDHAQLCIPGGHVWHPACAGGRLEICGDMHGGCGLRSVRHDPGLLGCGERNERNEARRACGPRS